MAGLNTLAVNLFVFIIEIFRGRIFLGRYVAQFKYGIHQTADFAVKGFPGNLTGHGRNKAGNQPRNLEALPLLNQYAAFRHVKAGKQDAGALGFGLHQC